MPSIEEKRRSNWTPRVAKALGLDIVSVASAVHRMAERWSFEQALESAVTWLKDDTEKTDAEIRSALCQATKGKLRRYEYGDRMSTQTGAFDIHFTDTGNLESPKRVEVTVTPSSGWMCYATHSPKLEPRKVYLGGESLAYVSGEKTSDKIARLYALPFSQLENGQAKLAEARTQLEAFIAEADKRGVKTVGHDGKSSLAIIDRELYDLTL